MKYIITISVLAITSVTFSQAIIRQSINAYGSSAKISNSILIEQSAGQGQAVSANEENSDHYRPGFIQSRTFLVEESEEDSSLSGTVYPNPARDGFDIEIDERINSGNLSISNAQGKMILTRSLQNSSLWKIDAASWQNGVYFITLQTDEGKIFKRKLIISN